MRKHPMWDEDAFAVVVDVTTTRTTDDISLANCKEELCSIAGENAPKLRSSLSLCNAKFLTTPEEANYFKQVTGIDCAPGQKVSRLVNGLCHALGVASHPNYNSVFAKLSDALNPLTVTNPALLSVHPCDYLEMSGDSNSWRSCHNLRSGCYKAGTLSYMLDDCSMIFYTTHSHEPGPKYNLPKINREVFCYAFKTLLQSRLYPDYTMTSTMDVYRDLVQRIISTCLDTPNLWHLLRAIDSVQDYAYTDTDSLHYADYEYEDYHPTISLLPGAPGGALTIGHEVPCLLCGKTVEDPDCLICSDCSDAYTCSRCGYPIPPDDVIWIDDLPYCSQCVAYCTQCDTYTTETLIPVTNECGEIEYVCPQCAEHYATHCCEEVAACV